MMKDDASCTSLLLSSPDEAVPPSFAGIADNSQFLGNPRGNAHTVHRLVVVGASAPMLATARRMMNSVKTYLIHLDRGVKVSHRPPIGIESESATIDIAQVGTAEGMSIVKSFTDKIKADAIVSDDDWTLLCLARNRARFEPGCKVLAPDASLLERLWDKSYQVGLAQRSGFDVLPTYTLKTAEDVAGLPEEVFPAVVRPSYLNSASPNFKAKVLASRDEAVRLYSTTAWSRPPILQRFCLGPNMVLHGIRAESGELLELRLFHVYRKYRGFSASMQPVPLPAEMEAAAQRFVEAAGLTGPFHFDLLVNSADEKVYFLEINTRLGGTTGKVIELGYDEPGLLLRAFHAVPARPLAPLPAYPRVTSVRLNLTQAWNDLFSRRDPLAYPQLPRAQSVLAALKEIQLVHHG
jgi:predicted ATP-grasp superfamily ATP-dependent carboligase